MKMIKEVLRLFYTCGLTHREIAKSVGCSRGAIGEYIQRAKAAGLDWPLACELDESEIEKRLFTPVSKRGERPLPDFSYIHTEKKKKGVTLIQLWAEYKEDNPNGYEYTQFAEYYRRLKKDLNISMRQQHEPGRKVFSDFAGKTLAITDPDTGEVNYAHLFVCTLGASNFTFAELFWNEKVESWCNGHALAFEYFGGCPKIIVPDNPKAVIIKASSYDPDIHPSFAQMAAHFGVAVIPARVGKPKDKAKVEAAVLLATRWILAVLRNRKFFSLEEARAAVRELLEKLNDRNFKKMPGSRRSQFEEIDKPALLPLPATSYEFAHFKKATVNVDYHIEYDSHYYSVPFQYRHEVVEVRATASIIEIFRKGKRIASHPRGFAVNKASTLPEHRPKNHRDYGDWPPQRIIDWAHKVGPSTGSLIKIIMDRQQYPEQSYRTCFAILRLAKLYSEERLESACTRALAIRGYSPKSVKSILDSNLDRRPLPEKPIQLCIVHENIRGANAFVPESNKENEYADSTNTREPEDFEATRHG